LRSLTPTTTATPYTTLFRSARGRAAPAGWRGMSVPSPLTFPPEIPYNKSRTSVLIEEVEVWVVDPKENERKLAAKKKSKRGGRRDRESTRLNSSHEWISYAV